MTTTRMATTRLLPRVETNMNTKRELKRWHRQLWEAQARLGLASAQETAQTINRARGM